MGKKANNRKRQKSSFVVEKRELRKSDRDNNPKFAFSFADLDPSQGQDFAYLLKHKLATRFFDRLFEYSKLTFHEAKTKNFKVYGRFPPSDKTEFTHPIHVPPDAVWFSFHLQGGSRIIGHLIKRTLFIVFIDCHHKFWKSEKRHT